MSRFTVTRTILASVALFISFARVADAAEGRVTFERDVLPILAKHCQNCHHPGQVAQMSFLTYETTRPWAAQIKAMLTAKKMPPSVRRPHHNVLRRGKGLTQTDIETIVAWVDGEPEGEARDAKPSRLASSAPGSPTPSRCRE